MDINRMVYSILTTLSWLLNSINLRIHTSFKTKYSLGIKVPQHYFRRNKDYQLAMSLD